MRRERVYGSLLGGAIGDALGAAIEFDSLDGIRRRFGPAGLSDLTPSYGRANAITDDTQMTLLTAAALVDSDGAPAALPGALWRLYRHWAGFQTGCGGGAAPPPGWLRWDTALVAVRAPGNSCLSGLAQAAPGSRDAPANPYSKGCGAIMRSAPFGLATADPELAWSRAWDGAVLTHGHPSGVLSAAGFAWLICGLGHGAALPTALDGLDRRLAVEGAAAGECRAALAAGRQLASTGRREPEALQSLGGGWTGEEALAIAVYAASSFPAPANTRSCLLLAVNHSGDSDSTGSLAGNIVGAMHGSAALPADWAAEVEGADLVRDIADRLAGVRQ